MGEGDREVISYRFYSNHLQKQKQKWKITKDKQQRHIFHSIASIVPENLKTNPPNDFWDLLIHALEFFAIVEFFKPIARDEISWCSFSIVAYFGLQQCLHPEILKYLEILQISFNFRIMHNILSSTVCIQNIWLESVFLREAVTSLCQFLRSNARGGERGKSKTSKGLRLLGWLPNTRPMLVFPVWIKVFEF